MDFKKVLVTGGTGFLGTHVIEELRKLPNHFVTSFGHKYCDLADERQTDRLFSQLEPDIVIHLAALCGGIGANQKWPADFAQENLRMGINVLEHSRYYNVQKVVLLSTCCEYPKNCPTPFKEEDLYNGFPEETNAPYAYAKKMIRLLGESYRKQYGLNVISLIPANLYGPGDHFNLENSHVIPALIRKFVEAKETGASEVELWGTGKPTREFLYVKDAARAIVLATQFYDKPEPVNIGNGYEVVISHLACLIRSLIKCNADIRWNTSKPDGQPNRCLDVAKAKAFGFEVDHTHLQSNLQTTIDWYLNNREAANER